MVQVAQAVISSVQGNKRKQIFVIDHVVLQLHLHGGAGDVVAAVCRRRLVLLQEPGQCRQQVDVGVSLQRVLMRR
jgi:hypothetical protein